MVVLVVVVSCLKQRLEILKSCSGERSGVGGWGELNTVIVTLLLPPGLAWEISPLPTKLSSEGYISGLFVGGMLLFWSFKNPNHLYLEAYQRHALLNFESNISELL